VSIRDIDQQLGERVSDDDEVRQQRNAAARSYKKKHAKQISPYGRRYREGHQAQRAEYSKRYRAEHADEIAEYKQQWREKNLEDARAWNRDYMRRKAAEERATVERRQRKAAWARDRYHADVEASRAKAREGRERQRTADPEGYREGKKRRRASWRERHKDEINAKLREKNLLDPSTKKAGAQRYYQQHTEERKAYRRQYYQNNRERQLASQKRWRDRERRRIEVGLPVRRLHKVTPAERDQNAADAHAFFSRPLTPHLQEQLKAELATPQHLMDALHRDWARIRAADYQRRNPETSSDTIRRRETEEARLDGIARRINERLRLTPRRDPLAAADPAYQPPAPVVNAGLGL
jgi:hypothetical protein